MVFDIFNHFDLLVVHIWYRVLCNLRTFVQIMSEILRFCSEVALISHHFTLWFSLQEDSQ